MATDFSGGEHAKQLTRHQYLAYKTVLAGTNIFLAMEAVSSTAIEHPEWDMEETKTWREWEFGV